MSIPLVSCACGCGEPMRARRDGKPRRFIGGHEKKRPRPDLAMRFWPKVDRRGLDECWPWTACLRNGYGAVAGGQRPGHAIGAHVASWLIHNGSVPSGLFVLHNCPSGDNPRCVNPRHLFLGTQADNMADMRKKERGARGEKHGRRKLTEAEAIAILAACQEGSRSFYAIARDFSLSYEAVNNIARGKSWTHLRREVAAPDRRRKRTEAHA